MCGRASPSAAPYQGRGKLSNIAWAEMGSTTTILKYLWAEKGFDYCNPKILRGLEILRPPLLLRPCVLVQLIVNY